jgi:hypothetical protein
LIIELPPALAGGCKIQNEWALAKLLIVENSIDFIYLAKANMISYFFPPPAKAGGN